MSPPILEVVGLAHRYPGNQKDTLSGVSLKITAGRRLAILGGNGSGKTTLFLLMNGTLRPRAGSIHLDGIPARYDAQGLARWRQEVGVVLQESDDQLFAASIAEDVSFGPLNLGLSREETHARVQASLQALNLTELADRPPHHLSHGQRKRAAIAGILAMRPRLLVLDEPTAGLDGPGQRDLRHTLEELSRQYGTTIVFSTHDIELAYTWAEEAAIFANGRILAQGPVTSLLTDLPLLERANLTPPAAVTLRNALAKIGVGVPPLVRSVGELAEAIDRHDSMFSAI
ncbi:MAG: ABC transporter ATP-binding protein [Magnetococcales bacterium]|nr:ABC transporter ATP-binding protein [Magnetococcales bacterium]